MESLDAPATSLPYRYTWKVFLHSCRQQELDTTVALRQVHRYMLYFISDLFNEMMKEHSDRQ